MPKMLVKENGGEVSASIDETNRVRALLGLKPLEGTGRPILPPAAAVVPAPLELAAGRVAGPALPSGGALPAAAKGGVTCEGGLEGGPEAVMALKLHKYTESRPLWR